MTDRFQSALRQKPATPGKSVTATIHEEETRLKDAEKVKTFLVTYRISKVDVPGKGGYDKRRDAVLERIEALDGQRFHLSTSAWKIKSRRDKSALVVLLSKPLDVKVDFVSVTQVGPTATFGDAELED
ncbi:hypothetical protein [Brevundimonas sp. SORGH_AS_0993]|uniref:hypothetical protein n=1 Tax=Brevundimonas sp. SORGH_AS_0993 TaxID=3041794 RepID=UPI0027884D3B|nr:hypothetical protein [Brevundimonas sp. SORGH_AS_0993]MDQ1153058.1 hypothetical protein [Brevundimonas sp. SORGH_AS_0993]